MILDMYLEKLEYCQEIPVKKNRICIFGDCEKNASCNYKEETKRLFCAEHKKENMFNIVNKKCLDCDTNYDDCENRRMMEISQDLGHRPVVFIRFNPDGYNDENNKKIKSCWSITKETGMIKINNKKNWEERLNVLKNKIQYWIDTKTEKTIENVHLFYDENA